MYYSLLRTVEKPRKRSNPPAKHSNAQASAKSTSHSRKQGATSSKASSSSGKPLPQVREENDVQIPASGSVLDGSSSLASIASGVGQEDARGSALRDSIATRDFSDAPICSDFDEGLTIAHAVENVAAGKRPLRYADGDDIEFRGRNGQALGIVKVYPSLNNFHGLTVSEAHLMVALESFHVAQPGEEALFVNDPLTNVERLNMVTPGQFFIWPIDLLGEAPGQPGSQPPVDIVVNKKKKTFGPAKPRLQSIAFARARTELKIHMEGLKNTLLITTDASQRISLTSELELLKTTPGAWLSDKIRFLKANEHSSLLDDLAERIAIQDSLNERERLPVVAASQQTKIFIQCVRQLDHIAGVLSTIGANCMIIANHKSNPKPFRKIQGLADSLYKQTLDKGIDIVAALYCAEMTRRTGALVSFDAPAVGNSNNFNPPGYIVTGDLFSKRMNLSDKHNVIETLLIKKFNEGLGRIQNIPINNQRKTFPWKAVFINRKLELKKLIVDINVSGWPESVDAGSVAKLKKLNLRQCHDIYNRRENIAINFTVPLEISNGT